MAQIISRHRILYDPVAVTWFGACAAAGSPVSSADQTVWSAFVSGLRADGILGLADVIAPLGAATATQALIDIVSLRALTAVNSPTFASYGGYTGNGTSSYVDSNFVPSTAAGNFSGVSAALAAYTRTSRTVAQASGITGSRGGTGAPSSCYPFYDTNAYFDINSGTEFTVAPPANIRGLWTMSRDSASVANVYQNGTLFTGPGGGTAPGTVNDHSVLFCTPTTGGDFSTDQIAFGWVSSGLDATKQASLNSRVTTLAAALGW